MAKRQSDPKTEALRERGTLNPHADRVQDPLFAEGGGFFDARDLLQVKYEMVRRVRVDGQAIGRSAAAFGISRPTFYQSKKALDGGGLAALLPKKRGPRRRHKLSADVVEFLRNARSEHSSVSSAELARQVEQRFGRRVHPRSVERVLAQREKKLP